MQIQNRLASALRTLSPRFPASVICLVLVLALHFWLPAVEPMPRLARITYNASAIFGGTVIVLQMARLLASGKPVLFSSLYQIVERIIRSEEHTSELQSLMGISYAVFCLK